jgi:hypothetical protein
MEIILCDVVQEALLELVMGEWDDIAPEESRSLYLSNLFAFSFPGEDSHWEARIIDAQSPNPFHCPYCMAQLPSCPGGVLKVPLVDFPVANETGSCLREGAPSS